jgi:hypothetical protein
MAPHSKGKGVKHLITEDKASIIAYKDAGSASSEIAAQIWPQSREFWPL